ncbi:MAG: YibE/F family protein [Synergistaceae bacterium]|nr:YibE/F family protein [Synergistaceae bacterium]MBQ9575192.1 YibE/F family protein [Synergistaceae bacterium]
MKIKHLLLRIVIALAVSQAFYYLVDRFTVTNWNNTESLIVSVISAGPESAVETEDDDDGKNYEMLERDTVLQVLSGNDIDKELSVKTVRLSGSGLDVKAGRRYLLVWDMFTDGRVQYSIADAFRVPAVAGTVMTVCTLLMAFTGWRGFLALLGLGASICVLVFTMIPLTVMGWDVVWLAVASVFIISTVTVLCVVRHSRYRFVALTGSLGGVMGGFLCGAGMVYLWELSGLAGEGSALLASTLPSLNMRGILLASVLIGSIGAVLDVSVSVTASMSEFVDYDENIPLDRLLLAGLNVGTEVLGSMINTLILAYMGSSLPMAVLICSAGVEFAGILNDPYIAQEIVQSLAGTLGLLFTIPATAFSFVTAESVRRSHG